MEIILAPSSARPLLLASSVFLPPNFFGKLYLLNGIERILLVFPVQVNTLLLTSPLMVPSKYKSLPIHFTRYCLQKDTTASQNVKFKIRSLFLQNFKCRSQKFVVLLSSFFPVKLPSNKISFGVTFI